MKGNLLRCGALWLASLWLTSCATQPGTTAAQPKPGQGLAEYRRLAQSAREAVVATVTSLDELARASTATVHPALGRFDKALHRLEVQSVTTRARTEAIRARGVAYFEEWKESLPPTNTTAGRAMAEQFARLQKQLELVLEATDAARLEFKPFMPALRNLRETLEAHPNPATAAASQGSTDPAVRRELADVTANGRRLDQALGHVLTALDRAATELRAVKPPPMAP